MTARARAPVQVRAGEPGVVSVAISPTPVLAVAGRLLGPVGVPLDGIPVKVQVRVPRDNFAGFPTDARFDGNPEIRTGPDGSFKTPKELDRKPSEFRVEVRSPGFLPARTPWVPVPEGDLLTLPDLTLKRARASPRRVGPGRRPRRQAGRAGLGLAGRRRAELDVGQGRCRRPVPPAGCCGR